jgi:arsenate reductase-like glutaredoxin family protein
VITLFHSPKAPASIRVHTLLKQANAQAVAHATEDQASSHEGHNKAERTEFELDVTEADPTPDQLRSILEYLGGGAVGKVVQGASDEGDAMEKIKRGGSAFQRPVTVDWHQGKVGTLVPVTPSWKHSFLTELILTVLGDNESEIMKMIRELPKETDKA